MTEDAELEHEQTYIDSAYACLTAMRERAESLVGGSEDPDLEWALKRRVRLLTDTGRPLCFGRIDGRDGERWYIGRRHVEDDKSDPVVVEWRAPIAEPFYQATVAEPLGLVRRRQLLVEARRILTMADDVFGAEAVEDSEGGPRVRGREALLAELDRSRTGEMFDIVATIQSEQDEVIRAPLEGVLVVQGGPGTGKTAIGLHRAAYLLYAHPPLSRSGVLVIGPNATFLRYIAQVLPSLGEEAVVQTTIRDLLPKIVVKTDDSLDAARVKGDARMAAVLGAALADRRGRLDADTEVRFGLTRLTIDAADAEAAVSELAARNAPYEVGRTGVRERLLRLFFGAYKRRVGVLQAVEFSGFSRVVRSDPGFKNAVDRLWPSVTPTTLVRELFGSQARLSRAADGVLTEEEQAVLARTPTARVGTERWTDGDIALLDEATHLIHGTTRTYGHIVADEAQDLSPMQVRMLARRSVTGSMTVLGDLAQGTGVWARDHWDEIVEPLPTPKGARYTELRIGYRAPGQVLALASRLLPEAAPLVEPTEAVRPGRTSPRIIEVRPDELDAAAASEAVSLATSFGSVAVISPSSRVPATVAALRAAGADVGDADRDGLSHLVTVVAATAAKGLEFDAVVVIEPALILGDAPRGLRLLYIAMTRPTQHLSIIHALPLPAALAPADGDG